ncbi:hypothetical protein BaRGS_00016889 [Batillaria attramentaria]|uniref:Uncharacterized protein n=1 Tax=Batillaria attramentaria TaxID=370345 RepID=A0ABD0KXG6_9CAEN
MQLRESHRGTPRRERSIIAIRDDGGWSGLARIRPRFTFHHVLPRRSEGSTRGAVCARGIKPCTYIHMARQGAQRVNMLSVECLPGAARVFVNIANEAGEWSGGGLHTPWTQSTIKLETVINLKP